MMIGIGHWQRTWWAELVLDWYLTTTLGMDEDWCRNLSFLLGLQFRLGDGYLPHYSNMTREVVDNWPSTSWRDLLLDVRILIPTWGRRLVEEKFDLVGTLDKEIIDCLEALIYGKQCINGSGCSELVFLVFGSIRWLQGLLQTEKW